MFFKLYLKKLINYILKRKRIIMYHSLKIVIKALPRLVFSYLHFEISKNLENSIIRLKYLEFSLRY